MLTTGAGGAKLRAVSSERSIMGKILYLLGAGASASCIPVVKEINQDLTSFANSIYKKSEGSPSFKRDIKFSEVLVSEFLADCRWLGREAQSHGTMDLFAKKLYLLKREEELRRLKCTLSFYLLFAQMRKKHDIRYDVFLTTVAQLEENSIRLPKDLIVSTWNYDNQIMISLLSLLGLFEPDFARKHINIYPWHQSLEHDDGIPELFHFNGLAGFGSFDALPFNLYSLLKDGLTDKSIDDFNQSYQKGSSGSEKFQIDFAWEASVEIAKVREKFLERIADVRTLVVVGYSFPTFNREFDRTVFAKCPFLSKIYVQDIQPEGPIERLRSLFDRTVEIVPVRGVDQFYIPIELRV
ncbi:hypothetical protein EHO61_08065 [Leptospira fluminis]|uniref:SIR2-like domain-containing protein n=1 Tax=Leptospira fluminis TaxID=2484979 RepID=A0A4V3JEM6_9LEPT|nr:hypothetical protein [Leptospira fluminis]TGK19416.1 hypothetical protein EHO61_08065 [Leptospira fluminis]